MSPVTIVTRAVDALRAATDRCARTRMLVPAVTAQTPDKSRLAGHPWLVRHYSVSFLNHRSSSVVTVKRALRPSPLQ